MARSSVMISLLVLLSIVLVNHSFADSKLDQINKLINEYGKGAVPALQ